MENDKLLDYQTSRLRDLITEIISCCEDRKIYESKRFNLTLAEVKVLLLFEGERYLTVKGIADRLQVAKSRVTKIMDGMIQKGLVERTDDPRDARVKLISLTPEGRGKTRDLEAFYREAHRNVLLHMDSDKRKELISNLEVLRSSMEAVKETLV
ncbi:MAG: MarR family transcriptional regulator [Deltaproteobacteria bacterium]|nr:MarR family transcriptional regulator [Deltaproteobacteria bacterium]